jgi:hypothetical protein
LVKAAANCMVLLGKSLGAFLFAASNWPNKSPQTQNHTAD